MLDSRTKKDLKTMLDVSYPTIREYEERADNDIKRANATLELTFDIERERTGGRRESPEGVELYRDEEWLREKYDEHGTVVAQVREEPVYVTEGAIKYWMDRHGIERAGAGVVGPEARREKGLMTYEDFLDALVDIHDQKGEWPTTTTYDDQRPSWAPSRSKAYQFSQFSGWGDAIEEAKEND